LLSLFSTLLYFKMAYIFKLLAEHYSSVTPAPSIHVRSSPTNIQVIMIISWYWFAAEPWLSLHVEYADCDVVYIVYNNEIISYAQVTSFNEHLPYYTHNNRSICRFVVTIHRNNSCITHNSKCIEQQHSCSNAPMNIVVVVVVVVVEWCRFILVFKQPFWLHVLIFSDVLWCWRSSKNSELILHQGIEQLCQVKISKNSFAMLA